MGCSRKQQVAADVITGTFVHCVPELKVKVEKDE